MKTRIFSQVLIIAVLVLSACSQAGLALPESGDTPNAEIKPPADLTDPESDQPITGKCGRNSDEVRLLINAVQGYCLQYPAEYDVIHPNESETRLFKRSVLNVSEPSVSIKVQPSGGTTVDQAADGYLAAYTLPESEMVRKSLTIDGEVAIMLDRLPGQDINRQVFVLHNGYLYQLSFMPMDESRPEVYAQSEALYTTVIQSFNFNPESNACPDCPLDSDTDADQTQEDPGSAMISGWVWHDQCDSGKDGQPPPLSAMVGCVFGETAIGPYHANGVQDLADPLIEGVVVSLGEGECPSTGLAEQSTIVTDLSYSFTSLKAGTYCVSIDPQREPNYSILTPGVWTFPVTTQGVISSTVRVTNGEYKGMVNFGWDYQFQP